MARSASWDGEHQPEAAWGRPPPWDDPSAEHEDAWDDPSAQHERVRDDATVQHEALWVDPLAQHEEEVWEEATVQHEALWADPSVQHEEVWDDATVQHEAEVWSEGARPTRRDRKRARLRQRAEAREARWQRNRLAIPYRTDGPKVTFGVLWFAAILGAATTSPVSVAAVVSLVAALAGLQAGYAWFPDLAATKWWTCLAAFVAGILGPLGPLGIAAGAGLGLAILLAYVVANPFHPEPLAQLVDVLVRSSLPVGIAAGSMAALATLDTGVIVALILLVSAYEIGDFLIGSGSSNPIEGPISGLLALGVVLFILWIAAPSPFTARSIALYGALAAVCCPLGQILASALLPRGGSWAPALRRADSYLVAAPLWLLLLETSPTSTSL